MSEELKQNIEKQQRMLSLIQPSGVPTLGNYLGALKNWKAYDADYDCFYGVADLHSITVRQEPAKLRQQIMSMFAMIIALGIDPEKNAVFVQSTVPAHAQLGWLLNCYTQFGELSRMTQFKDKSAKHPENINGGLFTYPSLMAADILLYNADYVPIGEDQKQHLELTRNVANRFNSIYGDVFTVPEPLIGKTGARVMSLQDPVHKMSKSDTNVNGCVYITDDNDTIMRKFKRAVTDSDMCVRYAEGKDGVNNLMSIYAACTRKTFEEIEREFEGKGYGDFKAAVGEAVVSAIGPVRDEHARLLKDKPYLEQCLKLGRDKAEYVANRTLAKVMRKVGFVSVK